MAPPRTANGGDTLTYSSGNHGRRTRGRLTIDTSSGQIKTKTGVNHNFNFEGYEELLHA